jgi:hypothetical protein
MTELPFVTAGLPGSGGALRRAPDGRVSPARFWLPRLALALLVTAALLAPLAWWALRR